MADPFSIAVGALNIFDVSVRVTKYLREIRTTSKHIETATKGLENEILALQNGYGALQQICTSDSLKQVTANPSELQDPRSVLLDRTVEIIHEAKNIIEELEIKLLETTSQTSSRTFSQISTLSRKGLDDTRRAIKLCHKQHDFAQFREQLGVLNMELNTMITAIDLVSNTQFRLDVYRTFDNLPRKIADELQLSILKLKTEIGKLEDHTDPPFQSIVSAKSAVKYASLNRHFYVQTPDISIWTGRAVHLEQLKVALLSPMSIATQQTQRRFVIHGIAGSGKTQVCSKFAQDFRQNFWGIFWIDASSPQSASASWKDIARLGGKEPHEDAGKYWLSNLESPWLLIIDSANDSEHAIQSNFPSGDRGCVLITTRNPRLIANATVGTMFLEKFDHCEADDLLRKATHHIPWDSSAKAAASGIAKRLGYLPLALVHAGRAILHQFCTLQGYISFFDQALSEFRRERLSRVLEEDEVLGRSALSSFEIIYSGLEAQASKPGPRAQVYIDALELGNVLAFFHCNDFRLETFIRAGRNLQYMHREAAAETPQQVEDEIIKPSWQRLKEWALAWSMKLLSPDAALPQLFRIIKTLSFDEKRVRQAIDLLVRMAVISESSNQGCYSMHPLVHDWLRNRMSIAEQALWCQTAGNLIASSIKLPPMLDEQSDRYYYIHLLSHVRNVQSVYELLTGSILANKESSWRQALAGLFRTRRPATFTAIDAGNLARYSRVFMESGQYADAEKLQRCVSGFLHARLGPHHRLCIRIQLALSATLWHQGRTDDALKLQEGALRSSIATAGRTHPQTLRIMDGLGETRWMCGQLKEAKGLFEAAINGMRSKTDMERDLLRATDHLGRVYHKYLEFELARELHERAMTGLTALLGEEDPDTWIAMDNLAMTLLELGGSTNTEQAHRLMESVYTGRVARFGAEHFYTLWAAQNLGRAMAAHGACEKRPQLITTAQGIMRGALTAALHNENLGPMHIGVLAGRRHIAHVDILLCKYQDAENELREIMELQKDLQGTRNGAHLDRIGTMQELLFCMEEQNRHADAIEICGSLIKEIDLLGGHEHPLRERIKARRAALSISSDQQQAFLLERQEPQRAAKEILHCA